MPDFIVYERIVGDPISGTRTRPTFWAEGARPLGTIRAPEGAALVDRGGNLALVLVGIAARFNVRDAIAAARRGAFGLEWRPADPAD